MFTKAKEIFLVLKIIAPVITIGGILVGIYQFQVQQRYNDTHVFKIRIWEKRLDTYLKLSNVTSDLLVAAEANRRIDTLAEQFNQIYYSSMPMLQDSVVEDRLIDFKATLRDYKNKLADLNKLKTKQVLLTKELGSSLKELRELVGGVTKGDGSFTSSGSVGGFWTWPGWMTLAAIATVLYTFFTFRLLTATKKSIDIANANTEIANKNLEIANKNREAANKLTEFHIYSRITDVLNNDKTISILDTIEEDWFDIEEIANRDGIVAESPPKTILKGGDIQRFVLGPIEDLAKFKEDGLLSVASIDAGFGNIILMLASNKLFVDYIKYLRDKVYFGDDVYKGFEALYEEELNLLSETVRSNYVNHFKS